MPQVVEEILEVIKVVPQERSSKRKVEQCDDVPEVEGEILEIFQDIPQKFNSGSIVKPQVAAKIHEVTR